ncbi:MAG: hypothetical protein KAZ28_03950 [Bacteroidaceae bacterium]|nr:hypothetical protein [Bacteroidaceae bacterium]
MLRQVKSYTHGNKEHLQVSLLRTASPLRTYDMEHGSEPVQFFHPNDFKKQPSLRHGAEKQQIFSMIE